MTEAPITRTAREPRLTRGQRANLHGYLLSAPSYLEIALVILIPFCAVVILASEDFRLIDIPRMTLGTIDWSLGNYTDARSRWEVRGARSTTAGYAGGTTVGAIGVGVLGRL